MTKNSNPENDGKIVDIEKMTKNSNPGLCVCVCVCVLEGGGGARSGQAFGGEWKRNYFHK